MKRVTVYISLVLLFLFVGISVVQPAYAEETTPETIKLPTHMPSYALLKEGYFWGWFPEKGAWEQVKPGTVPPAHKILKISMPILPKGFVWGWDEAQMRYIWLRVKDGALVVQRVKHEDRLGNWYWKEVTRPSPVAIELQD